MRFLLILTVMTVLLTTRATQAADYHMLGAGVHSCRSWSAQSREYFPGGLTTQGAQSAVEDRAWLHGYLIATNPRFRACTGNVLLRQQALIGGGAQS
jgi:hypothetical protein